PFEHYNVYLDGVLDGVTTGLDWVFSDLEPEVSYTAAITAQYIAGESLPIEIEIFFTPSGEILQSPLTLANHPNPFNPSTTISFSVEPETTASLAIFNQKGQMIRSWEGLTPGNHSLVWNGRDSRGRDVGSGVYLYRLRTRDSTMQRKMMLVK
ncbi:MAG: T9SS type A sorting domain-containing protein, partial [Candidatus Syntrophosphaera sp.]